VLVVFDLDGTLIDSRRDLADAANALIAEQGGQSLSVEQVSSMVGEGVALLVRRAFAAAGLRPAADADVARYLELYATRLLDHTVLYDGIAEAIDELSRAASLAVLTNKPAAAARAILDGLGIGRAFRWVYGGDGPHPRKPDPAGLLAIVGLAQETPGATTMVGDSPIDAATARAAGVVSCVARYGFGFRPDPPLRGDELVADAPADLPRLLLVPR
jgi:phosphoglycolate phosphatase